MFKIGDRVHTNFGIDGLIVDIDTHDEIYPYRVSYIAKSVKEWNNDYSEEDEDYDWFNEYDLELINKKEHNDIEFYGKYL